MNTGIIATRYATALLKLVEETGSGELVAAQVQVIEKALDEVPDFRRAVDDPAVAAVQKISLFEASLKDSMAQELHKFLELLIRNGRIGDVRLVLTTFVTGYYRSAHQARGLWSLIRHCWTLSQLLRTLCLSKGRFDKLSDGIGVPSP
ncbi:MAG: FoF1 ATP synthase subunit delta [Anaerovoracaceae bacterium]